MVEAAYADEGPTLKRWKPRARGRVNRIRKRTCHVTLVLAEVPEQNDAGAAARKQAETPRRQRRPSRRRPRERKKKEAVA